MSFLGCTLFFLFKKRVFVRTCFEAKCKILRSKFSLKSILCHEIWEPKKYLGGLLQACLRVEWKRTVFLTRVLTRLRGQTLHSSIMY